MLEFIGLGSAFHTKIGNTSAFIKSEGKMLLIDCGGTIFHRINELKLLDDVTELHIIITHTHPDHVGSLGEVIFYAYYLLKIKTKLYYPDQPLLTQYLTCIGVEPLMIDIISDQHVELPYPYPISLTFIPISHLKTVNSFALLLTIKINDDTQTLYYSGDSNEIPQSILTQLFERKINRLYQDTSGINYDGSGHLNINHLIELIPSEYRQYVYCIHLDQHLDFDQIKNLGFKIPPLYQKS